MNEKFNHEKPVETFAETFSETAVTPAPTFSFAGIWKAARQSLKGHWGSGILACLVPFFIGMAVQMIPFVSLVSGILLFPLTIGVMLFFLRLVRNEKNRVEAVFEPFRQYWRMLWGYFRVVIFVVLHFLLLIIPGYVAIFRYSMTYYIMLDNPDMSVRNAMILSREMMFGHKMQLLGYSLLLTLIGIPILIFTLGIGMLWYAPFVQTFCAHYYEHIRCMYERKQLAA